MNADHERDEWLMAEVALGKRDSLEPLVRRYATSLLTFLQRMTGDRHRSEELVQEVFLTLWRKRTQYQFPRPFRAWLYAIAVNKCRAAFRSSALAAGPLDHDALASASVASPVEAAIATETSALLVTAVTRLPPLQRMVVVLRIWDGLSYAQIGAILDRSEVNVRAHMHYGLASLRKQLENRLR